jgi:hypothetical protein
MSHRKLSRRAGTTTLEFAVVAPAVFLLFFAAYEFTRMSMIRHTVEMAAYEGARRGIVPGATVDDAIARANQVLAGVGTHNATVTVTPNPITSQTSQITVAIQVPMDSNSWIVPRFLQGIKFDRSFTLGRENVSWGLASAPPPAPPPQAVIIPPPAADDNHNSGNGQNGQNNNSGNAGNGNWGNGNWGNGNGGNGNGGNGNGGHDN